jgi:hypothetical protein
MGHDLLPNEVRVWFEDVTPGDVVVIDESSLGNDLRIPLRKVCSFVSSDL